MQVLKQITKALLRIVMSKRLSECTRQR